jgi:hypothetical protein
LFTQQQWHVGLRAQLLSFAPLTSDTRLGNLIYEIAEPEPACGSTAPIPAQKEHPLHLCPWLTEILNPANLNPEFQTR